MESGARRVLVLTLVRGGVTVVRYHTEIGLTDHAATSQCYYRVFIKYCGFFFENFKIYSGLWPLSISSRCQCVCTQWQVKHQHCSRAFRVKKYHNILKK